MKTTLSALALSVGLFFTSTFSAIAQQNTPCFEISRNTTSGPAGALLVNRCTGETWVLIGSGPFKWYPISKEKFEYVPPR
jgi:hypothetical protein